MPDASPPARRFRRRWFAVGAVVVTLGLAAACEWPYLNRVAFVNPLGQSRLTIRQDGRGDGHYLAPRSGRRVHQGIDLAAKVGDPVRAVRSGWVTTARYHRGYGKYIVLRHSPFLTTTYAHLKTVSVHEGARVRQGEPIGTVGKTGNARYRAMVPHLHFEIRRGGVPVDPVATGLRAYLSPGESDDTRVAAR